MSDLYSVQLKAGKFEKEAAWQFFSGTSDHCLWQRVSEDKNFDAKLTYAKFSLSTGLSIYPRELKNWIWGQAKALAI